MYPTRRVFPHGSLASAVCSVAIPAMARTAASAHDRIRIAIVGADDRSRFHLEALHRLTDAWLGPAPAQPYSGFRHERWRWDFSSGDMANQ